MLSATGRIRLEENLSLQRVGHLWVTEQNWLAGSLALHALQLLSPAESKRS